MSDETTEEKGKKDKSTKRSPQQRQATANPEPKHMGVFSFLVDLFKTGFPQKLSIATISGPGGKRLGAAVYEMPFAPSDEAPAQEEIVQIANRLIQMSQEDCDVIGKPTNYAVMAHDLMRSDRAYARKAFQMRPSGTSQGLAEERGDDLDDEGQGNLSTKLMLSLLDSERRDKRWMMETMANVLSGVLERDAARIENLETQVDGVYDRSIKYIAATEQMLNQAEDRKARAERARMWNEAIKEGVDMLKGTLMPAVAVYLSKGKVGIVQGLKSFMDGLDHDVREQLFGEWQEGARVKPGILDESQVQHVIGILQGEVDPRSISDFVAGLRPDQMSQAMGILKPSQVQTLGALAKAANDLAEREAKEQQAS